MKDKPLASLCILFYNQEDFVEDTIKGALSQTYDNLEIIISDDNSPDRTYEKIQKAVEGYAGPHRIIINRNTSNMGLVPHLNKVLFELSAGDLLFLNGGDDISLPNRVEDAVNYYTSQPDATSVTFARIVIDKYGKEIRRDYKDTDTSQAVPDFTYLSSSNFMTEGVAISFRREVMMRFGRLMDDCPTDDSTWRFRSILMGKTIYSAQYGLKYRIHDNNMSRNIYKLKTEQIANQYRKDLELVKETLSPQLYDIVSKKIDYYIAYRNLQSKAFSTSFIKRQLIKIKCFLLRKQFERVVLDFKKYN